MILGNYNCKYHPGAAVLQHAVVQHSLALLAPSTPRWRRDHLPTLYQMFAFHCCCPFSLLFPKFGRCVVFRDSSSVAVRDGGVTPFHFCFLTIVVAAELVPVAVLDCTQPNPHKRLNQEGLEQALTVWGRTITTVRCHNFSKVRAIVCPSRVRLPLHVLDWADPSCHLHGFMARTVLGCNGHNASLVAACARIVPPCGHKVSPYSRA